jgi:hypothetical protein
MALTNSPWPDETTRSMAIWERVFLWQCIAACGTITYSTNIADVATTDMICHYLESIHDPVESSINNMASLEFFLVGATEDCCKDALDRICKQLSSMDVRDTQQQQQKQWALICVQILKAFMRREDGPRMFLQDQRGKRLLDKLVKLACETAASSLAATSASIATDIVHSSLSTPEKLLSRDQSMHIVTKLLYVHSISIVESAIGLVAKWIETKDDSTVYDTTFHDCVHALAKVALSKGEYFSVKYKDQLVDSFIRLVRETKPKCVLARDAVIMETLVQLMAGTTVIQENVVHQRQYRTMTIKVVMEMIQNPCNRRILAKTPGLVSSMIRYARTDYQLEQTVDDETFSVVVSREELKRHIFVLAEAL